MQSDKLEQMLAQRTIQLAKTTEQVQEAHKHEGAALRRQTEWGKLMMAMQARIHQCLNLEEILHTTVAEVRQFLSADRVVVYKVEVDGEASIVAESVNAACTSLLGIKIATPLFKERIALYRQGKPRVIHDVQHVRFPTAINQFLQSQQVKASLTVPIIHANQFWGLLAIHQCTNSRLWQHLEVELLQQLATGVSIAIHTCSLYQQVVQLNTNLENQVQQRTAQLQKSLDFEATLKRISDDVRDTLDERQILQTAVWELAVALNIHGCNTGLYDANLTTSTISYEYTVGIDSAQRKVGVILRLGCPQPTPNFPRQGKVVQMQDFPKVYRQLLQGEYFQFCKLTHEAESVTILACPIFDNQGTIGDLWLFKQPSDAFDQIEIRLVQQVANQCAIAIRQARLYQAVGAKLQELETLNHLKNDFLDTSHELRAPVANMKMAIEMLGTILAQPTLSESTQTATKGKIDRYLQILQNECERELNLVNSLLNLQNRNQDKPIVLNSIELNG